MVAWQREILIYTVYSMGGSQFNTSMSSISISFDIGQVLIIDVRIVVRFHNFIDARWSSLGWELMLANIYRIWWICDPSILRGSSCLNWLRAWGGLWDVRGRIWLNSSYMSSLPTWLLGSFTALEGCRYNISFLSPTTRLECVARIIIGCEWQPRLRADYALYQPSCWVSKCLDSW